MGVRPSELWGIGWPLAAFYFDRAVRNWANFVDNRTNEAEQAMRMRMRNNRSRSNVESFAMQARVVTFNKLMGLSTESAYAAPAISGLKAEPTQPARNLDSVRVPGAMNTDGKKIDLGKFSG